MDKNWSSVYTTFKSHEADIAVAVLKDNNINAVLINKQVSMYPNMDSENPVDIFVANSDVVGAKYIIEKYKL